MKVFKSRMRSTINLLAVFLVCAGISIAYAENRVADPNQLFYNADHNYELREYQKALDGYLSIAGSGLESGSLYYNIGNCYMKMGQLGRAILFYEKAKRLMPNDSDLKANLSYAISLVESSSDKPPENIIFSTVRSVFESYSLRAVIFSGTVLYLLAMIALSIFALKPIATRRFRAVIILLVSMFLINLSGAVMRYIDERIVKHGIVVPREVECKYEPIEKSTTFYTLREGRGVVILNTRDGWRQIRRHDGKIGWVKKDSVEEI